MCCIPKSSDEPIPREAVDERLSLLDGGRASLRKGIDREGDPLGVFLYFGGKPFPTKEENTPATITRIYAYVGGDIETAERLFTASMGVSSTFTTEELYAMADEAVDFANAFRDTDNGSTTGYDFLSQLPRWAHFHDVY